MLLQKPKLEKAATSKEFKLHSAVSRSPEPDNLNSCHKPTLFWDISMTPTPHLEDRRCTRPSIGVDTVSDEVLGMPQPIPSAMFFSRIQFLGDFQACQNLQNLLVLR